VIVERTTQTENPAAVLLRRRQIRRSYEQWCRHALIPLGQEPALHHLFIIRHIEKVLSGEIKNLIFLLPPGSAKSTYLSVLFPPFYLNPEQNPKALILACSYSYTLIESFGRQCRDLIDLYENDLGYSLSKTAAAAGDWRTSNNGGYFCAGVGGGIAGHRADLAFIDDYLGNEEDADSENTREKQWLWFHNDFRPRLKPNAATIIIANRRHEDDLVGRLLENEPERWTVVKLPMLAEENDPLGRQPGERLWKEWFTDEMVQDARKIPRTFAGLYQQRPRPDEGNEFKKEWLVGYTLDDLRKAKENGLRYYVGADYAVKKGKDKDFFCFLPVGMDSDSRIWILPDWWWVKSDTGEAVEEQIKMAERVRPLCWWAGKENITGAIGPFLYKRMWEENVMIPIEELSESKDKVAKAQAIKGYMSNKRVLFPKFLPDWERAENELLTFPGGTHDDFVDALSKIGQGLMKMTPARARRAPSSPLDVLNQPLTCGWAERSDRRRKTREGRRLLEV
jgi:predicted phage terminase large subunit-like protein